MASLFLRVVLFVLVCGWTPVVMSATFPCPSEGMTVGEINYVGLRKTKRFVIDNVLEIHPGDPYTEADLKQTVQEIINLEVFSDVETEFTCPNAEQVNISISIYEKWTILPIIKATRSGDSFLFQIGGFNRNFLGRYLDVGFAYTYFNALHGFKVWYEDNFFGGVRQTIHIEPFVEVYNQLFYVDQTVLHFEFVHQETGLNLYYEKFFKIDRVLLVKLLTYFEYVKQNEVFQSLPPPPEGVKLWNVALSVGTRLGRIEFNNIFAFGTQLETWFTVFLPFLEHPTTMDGFWRFAFQTELLKIKTVWGKHQLGMRLKFNIQNHTPFPHDQLSTGGMFEVRGLLQNQFKGDMRILGTIEFRPFIYESKLVGIQGTVFVDTGVISEDHIFDHIGVGIAEYLLSTGVGVRIYLPAFYRAVLRIDFAALWSPVRQQDLVIGVQQFF